MINLYRTFCKIRMDISQLMPEINKNKNTCNQIKQQKLFLLALPTSGLPLGSNREKVFLRGMKGPSWLPPEKLCTDSFKIFSIS